ncbi:RNA polymerase sigma-70 factor (ECF subfamily) [Paenibacillus endophyticus]|uniref:RNA polymerase sigma-70 factor (ECF subfamily) n=1 Tax=Paenibacillus endophyticus TaxID=1294268 RepID=A0A7W5C5S5_9BACL|nr:RNA polymerase sigma factor SigJ [Paenibacillus endophyticus]MBB3151447.1 RNA polymerase sigma-70 factor (ECF subfamily) [Paenibacillus endophyticus]
MEHLYEQYKRLLLSLAYQLTGSFSDAEDVVQDVFLKVYDAKPQGLIEAPQAYLCRMVTNRCSDLHKSAAKRKEKYFGEWLPEPVPTSTDETFEMIARNEMLSYGMLVLLEQLSAAERAVFVLREAFGFSYADIAAVIDKSEANSRKLYSRARVKLGPFDREEAVELEAEKAVWVKQFLSVLGQDDVDQVLAMLGKDVVLISDGGGKVFSAVNPIVSPNAVSRFLLGLVRKNTQQGGAWTFTLSEINGQLGLIIHYGQKVDSVFMFQVENGLIHHIYIVRNPDKLKRFL